MNLPLCPRLEHIRPISLKLLGVPLLFLSLCGQAAEPGYKLTTVAQGLVPWSIAFLPNGDRIITELPGRLRRITSTGEVQEPISGVPEVYFAGQGGLFDVLLAQDFKQSQTLYLSYSSGNSEANATTVAKAQLVGNTLQNVTIIFTASPTKYAPQHFGGRLAWMADGTLLLSTGDGFDFREQAQNISSHLGKTIRINADGTPASGNPFADSPYVWTYGHRNPQGLAVTRNGTVYLHEHGPRGGDEVNKLFPGGNFGWPAITYGMDYNGAFVTPFTQQEGMEQPQHVWVSSIGPSGLMIYEGNMFPEWQGDFFVGALVNKEVRRLSNENSEVMTEETVFDEIDARIRDIREAPDGSIYVLTDPPSGRVIWIRR